MAKKGSIAVDEHCTLAGACVHEDFDCILNQTNVGANNNKFYVIQLLVKGKSYYAYNRWGRVGEVGQMSISAPMELAKAQKAFEAKFRDKTSNAWAERLTFKAAAGRYTLIEVDRSADQGKADEIEKKLRGIDGAAAEIASKKKVAPSKLAAPIERLMQLIFDHEMFKGAMASFDIDVKKMPLGQLSKTQVQKGYAVLDRLGKAIEKSDQRAIVSETSAFYTVIPHAFGRRTPPLVDSTELLEKKVEMLNVLNDIEIAISMQKQTKADEALLLPNPADEQYAQLEATLDVLDPESKEFALLSTYVRETAGGRPPKILSIFKIDRKGEAERFREHDKLGNRKLLFHGTNVAVVAAICKTGLRIMPHSGGRVGKGIYAASECGKSLGYMRWNKSQGVMFLAEVALGKVHEITKDDSSLVKAPKGYDSIVARGQTEPDAAHDRIQVFDGQDVIVPQGKPTKHKAFARSSFSQSEYLVYRESQIRLRYALHLQT